MGALVSVVIPTYNHARFLGRALRSVVEQTYAEWEAWVVDNHSDDDTEEVVTAIGNPRIRLLKIHNNGVIAASRNLGMRHAGGEWIAFLDSDDCWYPRKLETVIAAAQADRACDVVSNDELMVDIRTGARKILRHGPYREDFYRLLLVGGNRLSPSATVVRREFLDRHGIVFDESPDYATVEDYGFWLDLARNGAGFRFVREVHGEFVVHGSNSSDQVARHWRNGEKLLRDHVFNIQAFDPSPSRLWGLVSPRLDLVKARLLLRQGRYGTAIRKALETVVGSPRGTMSYLMLKLQRQCGASSHDRS